MEKVDIYNKFREKIGIVKERNNLDIGEFRISTHIWIKDSQDRILAIKRSKREKKFPEMWAQVGGGVIPSINPSYSLMKNFNECYMN